MISKNTSQIESVVASLRWGPSLPPRKFQNILAGPGSWAIIQGEGCRADIERFVPDIPLRAALGWLNDHWAARGVGEYPDKVESWVGLFPAPLEPALELARVNQLCEGNTSPIGRSALRFNIYKLAAFQRLQSPMTDAESAYPIRRRLLGFYAHLM